MSTSIHIPEGLHSFHIRPRATTRTNPITVLLKRVVADLQRWLDCSWAAGMVPGGSELVPELNVVCVAGDSLRRDIPDLICPVRGNSNTGLAAIVAVGPRSDGTPYSDEDHRFADALCDHLSGLLGNERLALNISEDLLEVERNQQDAVIARTIYDRLDHCHAPQVRGLEYGGQCCRATKSGGDFFDLLPRGDRELVAVIGNVDAQGMPGGIMLGEVLGSARALVNRVDSLAEIAVELNRILWELSPENSFTSFFCAKIDASHKWLRYVSAGHEPALILRGHSSAVDRLEPTGAILGLSRRSAYRERMVPFEPGDLVAAFTDGVAESTGPSGVVRLLREGLDCGVQEMAAHVVAASVCAADRTIVLARSNDAEECPEPLERFQLAAA